MKQYRTEVIKEVKEVFQYKVCDSCGARSDSFTGWPGKEQVNEVDIEYRYGSVDRDGGASLHVYTVDICPTCFEEKVITFLKSIGADCKEEAVEH
jgi:hypothetical protein